MPPRTPRVSCSDRDILTPAPCSSTSPPSTPSSGSWASSPSAGGWEQIPQGAGWGQGSGTLELPSARCAPSARDPWSFAEDRWREGRETLKPDSWDLNWPEHYRNPLLHTHKRTSLAPKAEEFNFTLSVHFFFFPWKKTSNKHIFHDTKWKAGFKMVCDFSSLFCPSTEGIKEGLMDVGRLEVEYLNLSGMGCSLPTEQFSIQQRQKISHPDWRVFSKSKTLDHLWVSWLLSMKNVPESKKHRIPPCVSSSSTGIRSTTFLLRLNSSQSLLKQRFIIFSIYSKYRIIVLNNSYQHWDNLFYLRICKYGFHRSVSNLIASQLQYPLKKNKILNGLLICLKWLFRFGRGGRTEWPTENIDFKILL